MGTSKLKGALLGMFALLTAVMSGSAMADYALNMTRGVTEISKEIYALHMLIFYVCAVIAAIVFGLMIWSILHHRKSRGAVAETFHHNLVAEIIWTIVPFVILVAMAVPAAKTLIKMENFRDIDMSIKVTALQWKWHYDYMDEGVSFYSSLSAASNAARQLNSGIDPFTVDNYLRDVDNPMVIPVGKKIRLLMTSQDVLHAWWVPELGGKKDAIPGFVNEMWFRVEEPGVYRGQCAELCGRDHGFMPVVVHAVPQAEYEAWIAENSSAAVGAVAVVSGTPAEASADTGGERSMGELMQRGEEVYSSTCAACHQANGEGLAAAGFPPLKGSALVTDDLAAHINQILNGKPGTAMTAFGNQLNDADIAAVVTYERNAWGNDTGDIIQTSDITAVR